MSTPSDIPISRLSLGTWSEAQVQQALEQRPLLVLLERLSGQESPKQKRIILLVHGLNSSAATWLTFLSHAFRVTELQPFDFGLFNYQTSLVTRLNPFQRLPRPEDWARVLANVIRNTVLTQEGYDSYVLVGHSMGGLISKFAIRYLLESDIPAASHLHSLFTYGTPNHGSDRATPLVALLSPDLGLLRAFSAPVQDLQTFWNSRISAVPGVREKFTVHERAVVSLKDYWVAPASGISSLPESFVQRLASSHTGLLKPASPTDLRISWFVEQLKAVQRQSECTLIDIRNGPIPEDFVGNDVGKKLIEAIYRTVFVLDAGTADGLSKGDKFALYYDPTETKDSEGRVMDRKWSSMNLLQAIDVKERVTYCKLEAFAGKTAVARMQRAFEARKLDQYGQEELKTLTLALFGRRALRIQRAETDAQGRLEEIRWRVRDQELGSASHTKALLELLSGSRDFLVAYPGSVLAFRAAYLEAWATMHLERYDEAEQLFERFAENYWFTTSVSSAKRCLDEIRLRIKLRDSNQAPEAQLELAEYLIKSQKNFEEGLELAFEAFVAKPELVHQMAKPMRITLAVQHVLHKVLGMDTGAPKEMVALLNQYAADPTQGKQMRDSVSAKAAPERVGLLLKLLDSVGVLGTGSPAEPRESSG